MTALDWASSQNHEEVVRILTSVVLDAAAVIAAAAAETASTALVQVCLTSIYAVGVNFSFKKINSTSN
jgi:hypothetical protein